MQRQCRGVGGEADNDNLTQQYRVPVAIVCVVKEAISSN